ncbi:hypothetical protein [Salmonella enterica]|uniref:hypothetical protein n=1 Tax=Salmonella enterica TaxID=28901 RepID=UPI003456FFBC
MSLSAAITVLTGGTVFVAGQLFSKRFIEPYISFREQLGRITALLLREQATIINSNASKETIHELKGAAAQLMAKYSALPRWHNTYSALFDQRFASVRTTGNLTFSTTF